MWAEDCDSDRYLIQEALTGTGFEAGITFAVDGEEALREVARVRPVGVVLDLDMPGMDGITALRRIREEHGDVPVAIFSTTQEPDKVLACRELGVVAYAVKPIDFMAFRLVVSGILAGFRGAGKPSA